MASVHTCLKGHHTRQRDIIIYLHRLRISHGLYMGVCLPHCDGGYLQKLLTLLEYFIYM